MTYSMSGSRVASLVAGRPSWEVVVRGFAARGFFVFSWGKAVGAGAGLVLSGAQRLAR